MVQQALIVIVRIQMHFKILTDVIPEEGGETEAELERELALLVESQGNLLWFTAMVSFPGSTP